MVEPKIEKALRSETPPVHGQTFTACTSLSEPGYKPYPFTPSGLFYSYKLAKSIFHFRVWRMVYFLFDKNPFIQTLWTLIKHHILRRLIWIYTVCLGHMAIRLGIYPFNADICILNDISAFKIEIPVFKLEMSLFQYK